RGAANVHRALAEIVGREGLDRHRCNEFGKFHDGGGLSGYAAAVTSPVNLSRSILPPETTQTVGPSPARPVSAAASERAPAPSAIVLDFSAINRIALRVSSSATVMVPSVSGRMRCHIRSVTLLPPAPSTKDACHSANFRGPPSRSESA